MKKQTAVEWLIEALVTTGIVHLVTNDILEQAKETEKQQIIDAYVDGRCHYRDKKIISAEQYYNETFK